MPKLRLDELLGTRGFGHLYKPTYKDRRTGEVRTQAIWWLKWGHAGKTHRESTKTSDHAAAERYRKEKFKEIWAGRMPWQPRKEATLDQIAARAIVKAKLLGRRSVEDMELSACRLFGEPDPRNTKPTKRHQRDREMLAAVRLAQGARTRASHVTEAAIDDYTTARLAQGYKAATVNKDLAFLRRAFGIAYQTIDAHGLRMVERIPTITKLREANARAGYFEEGEFRAVQARLPACYRPLVEFAYVTGWRPSEVKHLLWSRVNTRDGRIDLRPEDVKSGQWRDPWPYRAHPALRAVIEGQLERKRQIEAATSRVLTHVFTRDDGAPIKDYRCAWYRARDEAGLPNKIPHDFCRTAARNLIMAGVDRKRARRLVGRKTDSIFDRYHIVTDSDQVDAVTKLAAHHATLAGERPSVEPIRPPAAASTSAR